jgi:hypothetical protein
MLLEAGPYLFPGVPLDFLFVTTSGLGPLVASLYDLGPTRCYRLAAIERPEP